jgi:hypothetical protein
MWIDLAESERGRITIAVADATPPLSVITNYTMV